MFNWLKIMHFYIYFIDEETGAQSLRTQSQPTWGRISTLPRCFLMSSLCLCTLLV